MDARRKLLIERWTGIELDGWVVGPYIGGGKSALVFHGTKGDAVAAVKIFDPEIIERFGEDAEAERVRREVELVGASHPNLVKILGGGYSEDQKVFFISMEFLDAPNLASVLDQVPIEAVPELIEQLASAAKFLHDRGVLHRDIKPENIAVSHDFRTLTLLDLGVIRPYESDDIKPLTDKDAKVFVGTLQYSSPEYLLRKESSGEAGALALTFYQIGAVLHDLLTKQPIFSGETEPYARLVQAVLEKVPEIPVLGNPPRLVSLSRSCLVKDPETRLKLVSWSSFDFHKSNDEIAMAKATIKNKRLLASDGASPGVDADGDLAHRTRVVPEVLASFTEVIRQERVASSLPPCTVKDEYDVDSPVGTVDVRFIPAPRSGLDHAVQFRFEITVLQHDPVVVSVESSTLIERSSGGTVSLPKLSVTGVYDDNFGRQTAAEALYPGLAKAMES